MLFTIICQVRSLINPSIISDEEYMGILRRNWRELKSEPIGGGRVTYRCALIQARAAVYCSSCVLVARLQVARVVVDTSVGPRWFHFCMMSTETMAMWWIHHNIRNVPKFHVKWYPPLQKKSLTMIWPSNYDFPPGNPCAGTQTYTHKRVTPTWPRLNCPPPLQVPLIFCLIIHSPCLIIHPDWHHRRGYRSQVCLIWLYPQNCNPHGSPGPRFW